MKCITVAALLSLLASAANLDARQAADLKYQISGFSVACTPESADCFYELNIVTSDNPEFQVGCEVFGTSEKGELPAVSETQCGTYTVAVAKSDDGGLILTVKSDQKRLMGSYTIPSDDITTTTSGGQSYTGDSSFTIDVKNASGSASVSGTRTTVSTSAVSSATSASSVSSVSSTAASEPSTTGSTTSSSASPSETNGATQKSAFASVMFAAGLMAFIIRT